MSRDGIRAQAAALRRPGSAVRCVDDGEAVVVILEPYAPPNADAFTPSELAAIAFRVPETFPDASPDPSGFYVRPQGLIVSTTQKAPQSTSQVEFLDSPWLKFSWGLKTFTWDGNTDDLETFLSTVEKRFIRGD
jgi:hypothetical protein